MNEIIKALTELKDNRLLEIILKCTDDDIENQFQNNIQKLNDEENKWVYGIELSEKGQSGYEMSGEVRLLTTE